MRRGSFLIAAFLACASLLSALPSSRMSATALMAQGALQPLETACLGMSAPPEPRSGGSWYAPAPGRALPASSWPWALFAQPLLAAPVLALMLSRFGRSRRSHIRKPLMAHRIHAPPA